MPNDAIHGNGRGDLHRNGGIGTGKGQGAIYGKGSGVQPPVCFLAGTLINTEHGSKRVEDIKPGDKVHCLKGGLREVKWVGYRHERVQNLPEAAREDFLPILVRANALADNVPNRDLRVSPGHHLWAEDYQVLVRAGDLVNGMTILRDRSISTISYYHIELDQFDAILAHNMYSEAYADGGNRDFFQNVNIAALRPIDRERRTAARPGFNAARDKALIANIREQYVERAERAAVDKQNSGYRKAA